jgi:hypothetical protein
MPGTGLLRGYHKFSLLGGSINPVPPEGVAIKLPFNYDEGDWMVPETVRLYTSYPV